MLGFGKHGLTLCKSLEQDFTFVLCEASSGILNTNVNVYLVSKLIVWPRRCRCSGYGRVLSKFLPWVQESNAKVLRRRLRDRSSKFDGNPSFSFKLREFDRVGKEIDDL